MEAKAILEFAHRKKRSAAEEEWERDGAFVLSATIHKSTHAMIYEPLRFRILRAAAEVYPWFLWLMAVPERDTWEIETIRPPKS